MKLLRFIAYLFAFSMVIKEVFEVVALNFFNTNENVSYEVVDSVEYGGLALCIVGLSIFLKRDIWAYLFFGAIVASFLPVLSFTNLELRIFIGSLELNMIALPLLIVHVLLNFHLVRSQLSKVQEEESSNEQVDYFTQRFESKTDDELLRMDEDGLVPEAIEARKNMIEKRSL